MTLNHPSPGDINEAGEWDETTIFDSWHRWNEDIDVAFLANMTGDEFCDARRQTEGRRQYRCARPAGHGGRHLELHPSGSYPVAVWL